MRSIKFRAWDTKRLEMVYANGFDIERKCCEDLGSDYGRQLFMQFTGLLDKNGKEIYEGDIVRVLYTDWPSKPNTDIRSVEQYMKDIATTMLVQYSYNGFYVSAHEEGFMESMEVGKHGYIEVIGNIYENPELLTK